MKHAIKINVIDKGVSAGSGEIFSEEEQHDVAWDSILFDFNELVSKLPTGVWVDIENRGFIPSSHRMKFI